MVINIKNIQLDTEKIQENILENLNNPGIYEQTLKNNGIGFPTTMLIDLATIDIIGKQKKPVVEKPKLKDALKKCSKSDFNKNFGGLGGLGATPFINIKSITITAIVNPYSDMFEQNENIIALNNITTEWDFRRFSQIINLNPDNPFDMSRFPKYMYSIEELANKISNMLGEHWKLYLFSRSNMYEELDEELYLAILRELMFIEQSLISGKNKFSRPVLNFEVFEDVLALNLIKIISKGTDNIKTDFTGDCYGLVVEALVHSNYSPYQRTSILKRFIHSYMGDPMTSLNMCPIGFNPSLKDSNPFEVNIKKELNFRDDVLEVIDKSLADRLMCTRYIQIEYKNDKSLMSYKQAEIEEHKYICDIRSDEEKKKKEKEYNKCEIDTQEYDRTKRINVVHYPNSEDHIEYVKGTLRRLIIPSGMDLSNSFKAKYI